MIKLRCFVFNLIFLLLFILLWSVGEYHFYALEQNQLFIFSSSFVVDTLYQPGGLVSLISGWLLQFFSITYVGPLVVALLLTSVAFAVLIILRRMDRESNLFILALLPALSLLLMHFNMNYMINGSVAYLIMLACINLVIGIEKIRLRLVSTILLSMLLLWLAGPVSLLFAITIAIFETVKRSSGWYYFLVLPLLPLLLGILAIRLSLVGELRLILLPDGYYHFRLSPDNLIYYSWLSLPLAIIVVALLKRQGGFVGRPRLLFILSQIVIALLLGWKGYERYVDRRSYQLEVMDHLAGEGRWDEILKLCQGKLSNQLYVCYQNMALANKGVLAEEAFKYTQLGPSGLMVGWNKTTAVSALLSDVNFTTGNVAAAQEMAFESNITALGGGNPRMLKRLVQTNLIYGAYPVAEKYIALLEKTLFYDDWARDQRRFLYNDSEVEADPLLGYMRANLLEDNHLVQVDGFDNDMLRIAERNPKNYVALQYAGVYYLLAKNMDGFKRFIERYYGTELLPKLPLSYQEAVIIISERDESYWRRFGVSDVIVNRFAEYKRQVLAGQNNSGSLPGLMYRSFGDTYWYYYMFR